MNTLTTAHPGNALGPYCARVLLVEDNPADAELVRAVLEQNEVQSIQIEHSDQVEDAVARLEADDAVYRDDARLLALNQAGRMG